MFKPLLKRIRDIVGGRGVAVGEEVGRRGPSAAAEHARAASHGALAAEAEAVRAIDDATASFRSLLRGHSTTDDTLWDNADKLFGGPYCNGRVRVEVASAGLRADSDVLLTLNVFDVRYGERMGYISRRIGTDRHGQLTALHNRDLMLFDPSALAREFRDEFGTRSMNIYERVGVNQIVAEVKAGTSELRALHNAGYQLHLGYPDNRQNYCMAIDKVLSRDDVPAVNRALLSAWRDSLAEGRPMPTLDVVAKWGGHASPTDVLGANIGDRSWWLIKPLSNP